MFVISLKRLTTPLFLRLQFTFPVFLLHAQTTVHVPLTVARYSAWQYGYCRLDVAGGSPELSPEKPDVAQEMPIEYAGGRYHAVVGSVGVAQVMQTEYAHALPLFAAGSAG